MVPPGGSATLYGVLYQLLASVHHVVQLRLLRQEDGQKILGAQLVAEPTGGGGDLRIELPGQRIVEQWKARTTGKAWSLLQIVGKVLPDLYLDLALDLPTDETTYVFATEGHPTEEAQAFFERLRGPVPEGDPLAGLRREDRKILREIAKAVRTRQQLRSEPDSLTYPKLRLLLSRFEIREGQKSEDLVRDIGRFLLPLVDHRDDVPEKRERLCLMILSKAAHGEVVIVPEDLLREAGLRGVSLENGDELRRRAREGVQREVERRKYNRNRDVRTKPDWPEDKPLLILTGESGQGKTWQLARLALDLAREEDGNKVLAVFVVSQGDAARDLQQAADLLWQQAWDHDQAKSLDRVAAHWREVRGDTGQPWLAVCVDGVQSVREARALIEDFDWDRWGIRLALSASKEIGTALARERPEQAHLRILRDFTLPELRAYLHHYDRVSEDLPSDVRETLRRPLLAGIYTAIGSGPQWRPTREYQLYEEYWRWLQRSRDQVEHPEDLERVKRLALTLFDEEPRYPWTWEQLEQVGLTDEARRRLEQIGWWVRVDGGMEVWHDRLLSWALAEAVAERGSAEELAIWLRRDRRPVNQRIRRILAYLPLDVLWLLSGNLAKRHLVTDLIVLKEEEDQSFGFHGLYEEDLPSLGYRIVPSLIERLRRLADRARYSYLDLAVNALSKILDQEPDGRADLPLLLKDSSRVVREVAVGTLALHPHPDAVELLWDRLRGSSRSIDESEGEKGLTTYRTTLPALRACLELDSGWLRTRILEADPEKEPVWELAYLLANLKNPRARSIWLEVKGELFRKMPPNKLRSLAVCIRVFLDAEEVPRLERWLSVKEDWTDLKAFRALAWVDPDRAVQLLATLPLENLSDHHFGSWLPILLLKRPEQTRRALRDRIAASGPDFWQAADLYRWYEERVDCTTVELLLDRLSSDATWDSLRRPLGVLSRLHRLGLLQAFEKRAGTDLDRRLGELGVSWIDSPEESDLHELRSVLLKIGGEGIRRLIRASLASSNLKRQQEALVWGRMFPEEIAAATPREPGAQILLGEDRAVVEEVVALEVDNPWQPNWWQDRLRNLWRLRRGRPPMTDEDLGPAFEVLESGDAKKRMRGLEAVSISGRADLLSRLPKWLEGLGELEKKKRQELDQRAAYLVHRLAGETPESVRKLSQILEFGDFPSLLANLYGKPGAEALPDRLEPSLLTSLRSGRFGEVEMNFALTLSRSRELDPSLLREVWNYGKDADDWDRMVFWKVVARLDSDEILEQLWKRSLDRDPIWDERFEAVSALATLEPDDAFNITAWHLSETGSGRDDFVLLLLDLDAGRAIPWLIEQAVRERQTEILWTIARALRRAGPTVELELRAGLESPDFRVRKAAVHLAGWQGPGFLDADLQRMAAEDPDDDIQWECLQALDRQNKERCVLELMNAFRQATGTARWSYLESILELGDPRLLVTENDPLWLSPILTEELGVLEVHANWRLQERFKEVKRSAEQRDRNQKDGRN
jgi:hypothetical protein